MHVLDPASNHFWHAVTRLGDSQILLPLALLGAIALSRLPQGRPLAARWMSMLSVAVLATLATKVAFIGWGLGWRELDFTGISGHAMMAAAVYPLLFATLASQESRRGTQFAIATGFSLALLVGASRLAVGAHSASEVIAGLTLGGLVSAVGLCVAQLPRTPFGSWMAAGAAAWLVLMPFHAPTADVHGMVTRLSLELSGHQHPHTRQGMLRGTSGTQSGARQWPARTIVEM
jgi:membrane-associated phospholipid phosphatase